MQLSNLLLLLPALTLAAPSPSIDASAATTPAAACVYTTVASPRQPGQTAKAYAALMPNPQLTAGRIQNYFENFSFACKPGYNFTARQLAGETGKPWFGGDVQVSADCGPGQFGDIVNQAMHEGGNQGAFTGTCTEYKGGMTTGFQKAAGAYFAGLKKEG